jgi:hypothetical protein
MRGGAGHVARPLGRGAERGGGVRACGVAWQCGEGLCGKEGWEGWWGALAVQYCARMLLPHVCPLRCTGPGREPGLGREPCRPPRDGRAVVAAGAARLGLRPAAAAGARGAWARKQRWALPCRDAQRCAAVPPFASSADDFTAKLTDAASRLARGFKALQGAVPPSEAPLLTDWLHDLQRDLQGISLPTLRSYQQQAADLRLEVEQLCAQRKVPLRAAPTALATDEGLRASIRGCLREAGITAVAGSGTGFFEEQVGLTALAHTHARRARHSNPPWDLLQDLLLLRGQVAALRGQKDEQELAYIAVLLEALGISAEGPRGSSGGLGSAPASQAQTSSPGPPEPPPNFRCPITLHIMRDPVRPACLAAACCGWYPLNCAPFFSAALRHLPFVHARHRRFARLASSRDSRLCWWRAASRMSDGPSRGTWPHGTRTRAQVRAFRCAAPQPCMHGSTTTSATGAHGPRPVRCRPAPFVQAPHAQPRPPDTHRGLARALRATSGRLSSPTCACRTSRPARRAGGSPCTGSEPLPANAPDARAVIEPG